MHTGFIMIPEMIKSQSTDLVLAEQETKKLPMVIVDSCKALTVI